MKQRGHVIKEVEEGSIAWQMELEPGDRLISINGHQIEDVFDYQFYTDNEKIILLVEKKNGEEWEMDIPNHRMDLGLIFENGLMSEYRSCRNKCIFCFIDQMPPGMRETLYFKDDDSRLSFLQGNYITLTNMSDRDIERIIQFKLAPINISVQTMNPELRCKMLHNRFAGDALKKIDRLYEAGIEMNGQIVLCKGINDGEELERSIRELSRYLPHMQSVSVVPVGLSKYRDGLYPLEPFTKEDAEKTIDIIEKWQKKLYPLYGFHFIHASDEFYLLAGREMPEEERYDGYIQLENGVGMLRLLNNEVMEALEELEDDGLTETISIATGKLAYPFIRRFAEAIEEKFPGRTIHVYQIRNDFFGEMITVSGLITGIDLMKQLKDVPLGERLLLPINMLRSGEEVFLDDITVTELQNALQVTVNIVKSSGQDFVDTVLYPLEEEDTHYPPYELSQMPMVYEGEAEEDLDETLEEDAESYDAVKGMVEKYE